MSTRRRRKKKRDRFFAQKTVLSIQAIASIAALIALIASGMLPALYLIVMTVFLLLLLFLVYLLTVVMKPTRTKTGERRYVKRKLGYVLSVVVTIFCIIGVLMLGKLLSTMSGMSETKVVLETTAVYVLADNPAETFDDAKNYSFGYTNFYEDETTFTTIKAINKDLKTDIATYEYDTLDGLVSALYSGEAGAIILNTAYVDLIEDIAEYKNFSDETRVLYEKTEEVVIPIVENNDAAVEEIENDSFIIYISGNDARTAGLSKGRSDVNILGVVNPTTKQVLLVNTPRDYYVNLSIAPGNYDKLTHCGIYGVQCSMDTLANLYDCKINYFAQINFNGLQKLVDAVGGVTVNIEESFTSTKYSSPDQNSTYTFKKGKMKLDGVHALVYARERKAFSDGDLARGRHQMAVLKALIKKLSSSAILTHYTSILDSVSGMCATNVSSDEMSELVQMQLGDMAEWDIHTFSVTGNNAKKTTYTSPNSKRYVMTQDKAKVKQAKSLIQKVINGETLTDEDLE